MLFGRFLMKSFYFNLLLPICPRNFSIQWEPKNKWLKKVFKKHPSIQGVGINLTTTVISITNPWWSEERWMLTHQRVLYFHRVASMKNNKLWRTLKIILVMLMSTCLIIECEITQSKILKIIVSHKDYPIKNIDQGYFS